TSLMRNVIFGEASLVSADTKVERRSRQIHYAVIGAAAASILLMSAGWVSSYFGNSSLIETTEKQMAAYQDRAKSVEFERITTSDLRPILPLLAIARDLPGGHAHREDSLPILMQLGLYQGSKLGSQATAVYRRDLNRMLLPRMLLRLEEQLT